MIFFYSNYEKGLIEVVIMIQYFTIILLLCYLTEQPFKLGRLVSTLKHHLITSQHCDSIVQHCTVVHCNIVLS